MACQSAAPPPDPNAPQRLDLGDHTQEHLTGTYSFNGTTIGFAFEQANGLDSFVITGADGRELLRQVKTGDTLEMSVFAGAAKTVANLAIIRESARQADLPEDQRVPFDAESAVKSTGDQEAFARFDTTPEAAILPWLSRELGIRGFDGRSYPLTVRMHVIASNIAAELNLDIPQWTAEAPIQLRDGSCEDLQGDPHGDNSLGMCGPGTSCWPSTCGDCCCHDGCKSHDWTCRNCHWYTPWNCILCGTFTSFFDGACGTSCQGTTYAQPCTIGPYEQCNGHCICTGAYDGSTEAGAAPVQWGCQQMNTGCDPTWDPYCDTASYCMPM